MSHSHCSNKEALYEFDGNEAGKMGEMTERSGSHRHDGDMLNLMIPLTVCHVTGIASVASPQFTPESFLVTLPEMFAGLCDNGLEDG